MTENNAQEAPNKEFKGINDPLERNREITQEKVAKRMPVEERREQIERLIRAAGIWNLDRKDLGARYGVSRQTIDKDVNFIVGHMNPGDLRTIKIQLDIASKKAINEALVVLATALDHKTKLDAANTVSKLVQNYTEFAEAYGMKEPIVRNQINITKNEAMQVNIASNIHEALERARERWNSLKKIEN